MEKRNAGKIVGVMSGILLVSMCSCLQKSENLISPDASQLSMDQQNYAGIIYDVDDMVDLAVNEQEGITGGQPHEAVRPTDDRFSCATLKLTFKKDHSAEVPQGNLLIDFGASCSDSKGAVRSGKISIEFYGKRFRVNSYIDYTFDKYSIYGTKISGERKMTITELVENGNILTAKMGLQYDGDARWKKGTVLILSSQEQSRKWTHYKANSNNDLWEITGTSEGISRQGVTFSIFIDEPLSYSMACVRGEIKVYLPSKGKLTIKAGGDGAMNIDFGTVCDSQFTLSQNGVAKEIQMKAEIE